MNPSCAVRARAWQPSTVILCPNRAGHHRANPGKRVATLSSGWTVGLSSSPRWLPPPRQRPVLAPLAAPALATGRPSRSDRFGRRAPPLAETALHQEAARFLRRGKAHHSTAASPALPASRRGRPRVAGPIALPTTVPKLTTQPAQPRLAARRRPPSNPPSASGAELVATEPPAATSCAGVVPRLRHPPATRHLLACPSPPCSASGISHRTDSVGNPTRVTGVRERVTSTLLGMHARIAGALMLSLWDSRLLAACARERARRRRRNETRARCCFRQPAALERAAPHPSSRTRPIPPE
jgi:hypothetical protein